MKYFTIKELTMSATAKNRGIDNTPSADAERNLRRLVATVLDPARERLGSPIIVNSGYRCNRLNEAVGGAKRSYHLQGRAADLTTRSREGNRRLWAILSNLPHTELIWEHSGVWIHVAL